jgi:hypothetical protein
MLQVAEHTGAGSSRTVILSSIVRATAKWWLIRVQRSDAVLGKRKRGKEDKRSQLHRAVRGEQ